MTTTFEMNANELDSNFVKVIRKLFKDKKVQITVEVKMDETENLNRNEANRKMLQKSLEQAAKGETLTISIEQLKAV